MNNAWICPGAATGGGARTVTPPRQFWGMGRPPKVGGGMYPPKFGGGMPPPPRNVYKNG